MPTHSINVKRTLLLVAGTPAEVAFLRHLRAIYCVGRTDLTVTIRCADSTSCALVVASAARQVRNAHFDSRIVLINVASSSQPKIPALARTSRLTLVTYLPCFEGLLLQLLTGTTSIALGDCKSALANFGDTDWANPASYSQHLPKEILDSNAARVQTLGDLIGAMHYPR